MLSQNPIGIFDSGAGGLSVFKEIVISLPLENCVYYADTRNCPYGVKKQEEVIAFSENIVEFLLEKNVKLIVVACNTATGAAIDHLRKKYKINFVGMEPAVKPAAINTKTGNIGILATQGTFQSRLFRETSKKWAENRNIMIQVGEGLVELVEQGKHNSTEAEIILRKYIIPMLANNVDQLVLGCTHYSFFLPLIEKIVEGKAEIIDPAPAIARRVSDLLHSGDLLNPSSKKGKHTFYVNGDPSVFSALLPLIHAEASEIIPIK
ncbi:MAG: glutamate racemase [Bacteroidetes bacterium RIFOXYA12_FULL_35_11]|nr:MAG: glutamate racemase [Bacteroidetes bacterium GWF2_35_48]OFY75779.1 MAG: glutamate racemase [Bacteroidetes bacterium RIFOXYA12_FULL_35_11]OFY94296.1 MAG: glutamate racemase [Bacteroidetes bacterium RIFOXYB2_FULL_35_7]OFZ00778.1 MAG: glutamate racemase [Bacteroidetes bacterium RIFOXYC12_FULL_35_7]HBX53320.1 glutamate racemase [Bacteroidales bacterium]